MSEEIQEIEKPEAPEQSAPPAEKDKYKRDMLRYKSELEQMKEKMSTYEREKEEAKGNLGKVIEKLKSENQEIKKKYVEDRSNYAKSKIEDSIKMSLTKQGCKDPDTFYRLLDDTSIQALGLDEKFNPDKSEVETLVNENVKKYEHLGFFDKKVNVIDKAPKHIETKKVKSQNDLLTDYISKLK